MCTLRSLLQIELQTREIDISDDGDIYSAIYKVLKENPTVFRGIYWFSFCSNEPHTNHKEYRNIRLERFFMGIKNYHLVVSSSKQLSFWLKVFQ